MSDESSESSANGGPPPVPPGVQQQSEGFLGLTVSSPGGESFPLPIAIEQIEVWHAEVLLARAKKALVAVTPAETHIILPGTIPPDDVLRGRRP